MRAFCNWLEARGSVSRSPAADVSIPKVGKPLIGIIGEEECKRLQKACASLSESGPQADGNAARNRAILWLLYETGIRLAEWGGLRLADLDRNKGVIQVQGKGEQERQNALGRKALRALLLSVDHSCPTAEQLVEMGNPGEDHLFLGEQGCGLTRRGVDLLFRRLRQRVAWPEERRLSPRVFRHPFAVRFLMLGGDISTLQALVGHEDSAPLKEYMHLSNTAVQEQKRKVSPGDHMAVEPGPGGRKPRQCSRQSARSRQRVGRGRKPEASGSDPSSGEIMGNAGGRREASEREAGTSQGAPGSAAGTRQERARKAPWAPAAAVLSCILFRGERVPSGILGPGCAAGRGCPRPTGLSRGSGWCAP
ncbi:tyrosine-type recombinase/integrase [Thermogemmatispora tikiterensis]|uniref:tyrosine-type recombinase/integrase n=1 Tax=Thermogemmatispora tikiterensis TaxID=1825093 RepID=UPI000DD62B2E